MRAIINYSLILCLSIFVAGCQNEDIIDTEYSSLTLIVYMGGDNNLASEVVQKMSAIQSFARRNASISNGYVRILIYRDVLNEPARLYQCSYDSTEPVLLGTYGRENSASAEVFGRILRTCRQLAPADRYGLIVFSHASGWLPEGALNNPNRIDTRSVIVDGTSEMDMQDFASAIPDKMFGYIVFEACFMAGVEVAFELKDKTKYIMGSSAEMLSPGFTAIYSDILTHLISDSDTETVLTGAADVYFNHFDSKTGAGRSATISVIKTSELDQLAQQVKLLQPYNTTIDVAKVQHFDRNGNLYHLFFDLDDYISKTTSESLAQSIGNVVVYQRSTADFLSTYGGFEINQHCGLSTYIPQERFASLNREYTTLKWYQFVN